jgi:AcrR family transcriptional regulator
VTTVRGRKARKRLSPEQRREEILCAAHRVFVTHDPATVTFEEIAAEAGVSRALVYNYFGDKGSLLAEVYQHALGDLDDDLLGALAGAGPLTERLHAFVAHYVTFARMHSDTWRIIGHVGATQHPAVQSVRRQRVERFCSVVLPTAANRIAMAGLIGLLEEALTRWLAEPDLTSDEVLSLLSVPACTGIGPLFEPRVTEFVS